MKNYYLNIEKINVPDGLHVDLKNKYLEIVVRCIPESVSYINESDFVVQVDFSNATLGEGRFVATVTFTKDYERTFVVGNYTVEAVVTSVNG